MHLLSLLQHVIQEKKMSKYHDSMFFLFIVAILWVKGMAKSEVFVNGQKQGAPKGKPTTAKTR